MKNEVQQLKNEMKKKDERFQAWKDAMNAKQNAIHPEGKELEET